MSVQTVTDMRAFEADLEAPTQHFWPGGLPYRKSGAGRAQVGDLALCGYVKVAVSTTWRPGWSGVTCEECIRLREAGL